MIQLNHKMSIKDSIESWIILIHQIPPKPDYLRVKIGRRLQRVGAAAIKSTVYVLPDLGSSLEKFQWVAQEIRKGGGEAMICRTRFIEGISNKQVVSLFQAARNAEYEAVASAVRRGIADLPAAGERTRDRSELARLKRQLDEIIAIDFFHAPARDKVLRVMADVERRLRGEPDKSGGPSVMRKQDYLGRVWVTRRGIEEDRMASAWLIRDFIDSKARFRFVADKRHALKRGEVRFDMFEAEFTHDGDRCTVEVLLERFALTDPALRKIGQIVHDIDLRDDRFAHPETAGIQSVIRGIVRCCPGDRARLERGLALFQGLYESFQTHR